jgi:hypothetical protein
MHKKPGHTLRHNMQLVARRSLFECLCWSLMIARQQHVVIFTVRIALAASVTPNFSDEIYQYLTECVTTVGYV